MEKIILTKKIAKQGKHNIIIIPSFLNNTLKSGSVVKIELSLVDVSGNCESTDTSKVSGEISYCNSKDFRGKSSHYIGENNE